LREIFPLVASTKENPQKGEEILEFGPNFNPGISGKYFFQNPPREIAIGG